MALNLSQLKESIGIHLLFLLALTSAFLGVYITIYDLFGGGRRYIKDKNTNVGFERKIYLNSYPESRINHFTNINKIPHTFEKDEGEEILKKERALLFLLELNKLFKQKNSHLNIKKTNPNHQRLRRIDPDKRKYFSTRKTSHRK